MHAREFGIRKFQRPGAGVWHVANLDHRHRRRVGCRALIGQDHGLSRLSGLDIEVLIIQEEPVRAARVGIPVDGQSRRRFGHQIGWRRREGGVPLHERVGTGARIVARIHDAEVSAVEWAVAAWPPPDRSAIGAIVHHLVHHGVADGCLGRL